MTIRMLLADRALNRPLLITPDKAAVIMSVLSNRIGIDASDLAPEASRFAPNELTDGRGRGTAPYIRTPEGVGIITITGSLVNRGAYVGANSGVTSYEGIKHQLASAAADEKVTSVIIDLQSPGGEAVGAFETAAAVRSLAAVKPVTAVINGMAASAAYAIAAGATEIVTTETGVSGSIGVVLVHADYSAKLAEEGIKPTLIFAGAHKVDGNPFEPLPAAVREDLQAEVDAFYNLFIETVAAGRGERMTADMARATEARTLIGSAAVAAGLADRVGTFESVLAELSTPRNPSGRAPKAIKGVAMSETNGAPAATEAGFNQADLDAARAAGKADGFAAGKAEGVTEATARIKAVAEADGIKGNASRIVAAIDLAVKSPAMSAEDVAAFVAGVVPLATVRENPANALGADPAPDASNRTAGLEAALGLAPKR
jgi:signal peptide peptidase SppA